MGRWGRDRNASAPRRDCGARGQRCPCAVVLPLGRLAGRTLVLLARDALVFLVAWEAMTLSSYLLVTFDHEQVEVRRAGWVYLIAGHVGVTLLLLLFLLLARQSGSVEFEAFRRMAA